MTIRLKGLLDLGFQAVEFPKVSGPLRKLVVVFVDQITKGVAYVAEFKLFGPEEMTRMATEKTQEIKVAYDRIREARGT